MMLIRLAMHVTKILLKYGSTILTPPCAGDLTSTFQPSSDGSKSTHGIYVALPVTELKSLNDVDSAHKKGAITNIDKTETNPYFKVRYKRVMT